MTGSKKPHTSTTLQGWLILAFSIAANRLGFTVGDGERVILAEALTLAGEVAGLLMVLWGRLKATQMIKLP